jgi:alanine-glyoxylate transaminase/serine-glyoxylate transaminase/serine-pyruvate transaminase
MVETGWFAHLWRELAGRLGIVPELLETDWRRGAEPGPIEARLRADTAHEIKAVCVVHNETSTGCTTRIEEIRRAIDAAGHPALLMVDTISGLGSAEYRHDEWGVDVTVAGSQKGLMLPPGLSFNAISEKALAASRTARLPRAYWDWGPMLAANARGYFPSTPATNLLYGLDAALDMLLEEGLDAVVGRHHRLAEAARRAVRHWGLDVQCQEPRHESPVLTAVRLPEGHSADALRATILERFNMSLGNGLGRLSDRVFRIGHLGEFGELQLVGTLGGVEMGLAVAGVPHRPGGVQAAMAYLAGNA